MSGNYPLGAYNDPYAPYNWPENEPEAFAAEVQQTLHKNVEIYTDQYIKEGDPEYYEYDLSEVDWDSEYHDNDHYTPLQLIELYKKELETKLELTEDKAKRKWLEHMIKECSNWEEVDTEVYC